MAKKLTPKQEKFVQELVKNGGIAAEAYRAAYNTEKMKASTIERRAHDLKNNGKITARYEELMEPIRKKAEKESKVNAERIIEEYARIMNADATDFFRENGKDDLDRPVYVYAPNGRADTRAIKRLTFSEKGAIVGLELYDKMAAVSKLERIFDVSGSMTRDEGIKVEFSDTLEGFAQ